MDYVLVREQERRERSRERETESEVREEEREIERERAYEGEEGGKLAERFFVCVCVWR